MYQTWCGIKYDLITVSVSSVISPARDVHPVLRRGKYWYELSTTWHKLIDATLYDRWQHNSKPQYCTRSVRDNGILPLAVIPAHTMVHFSPST